MVKNILSSNPVNRSEFLLAAVLVLTVGKAVGVAAHYCIPEKPGLGLLKDLIEIAAFLWTYACLVAKRFNALGWSFLGRFDLYAVITGLLVWSILYPDDFWVSPVHYAIQAVLLLPLALFRDKPEDHADLEA